VSFLSPCVLPLVPGYVSYVAGSSLEELRDERSSRLRALSLAVCFVLGFSAVFIAFGASATALGGLLLAWRYEFGFVAGIILLLACYALGLGIPFLLAALFMDSLLVHLRRLVRFGAHLQRGAGGILVIMAVLMLTGRLETIAYWILEAFPQLARIG